MLSNLLEQEIGIQITSHKRLSSSGANVDEVENVFACDLSFPLHVAFELHQAVSIGVYNEVLFEKLSRIIVDFDGDLINYLFLLLKLEDQQQTVRTTIKERFAISTCKTQRNNFSLSSQLQNLSSQNTNDQEPSPPETVERR